MSCIDLTRIADCCIPRVELFPSTGETVSLVNGSPKPLHVFAISKERGTMTGYQLVSGGKGVALQSLWQLQLAGPHAHIEAVAFRNSHEKISSLGEVLSDGNVMYVSSTRLYSN